jgi:hypothetical protein
MEALPTHEQFVQNSKTNFQVKLDDQNCVDLELSEISDLKVYPGQQQFSVVFRGPNEVFLGQGMRSFQHNQLGQFVLFIVPIRQDVNGYYYEAVFSHLSS